MHSFSGRLCFRALTRTRFRFYINSVARHLTPSKNRYTRFSVSTLSFSLPTLHSFALRDASYVNEWRLTMKNSFMKSGSWEKMKDENRRRKNEMI